MDDETREALADEVSDMIGTFIGNPYNTGNTEALGDLAADIVGKVADAVSPTPRP